ncbi:hypothetical protein AVEN_128883-1 [Araneus ventricosus]|uniref:H15 domain-containing protein n=1 Tax=Araneus ventricosus TaxID=182803 RepID=A0A4Y2UCW6_ARAVE|nr:hypothetical protein AVEN_128883-1 [Araneus ventricosus]
MVEVNHHSERARWFFSAGYQKYIREYKVDIDRLTPFIRKYLKSAVAAGTLVQTKGKGANGSFKLSASGQKPRSLRKLSKGCLSKESKSPC